MNIGALLGISGHPFPESSLILDLLEDASMPAGKQPGLVVTLTELMTVLQSIVNNSRAKLSGSLPVEGKTEEVTPDRPAAAPSSSFSQELADRAAATSEGLKGITRTP